MRTIHQLPQHVIAKISAGEVIERPAYAVKELIENAIDAKADYITIHIEEAGLKKIIVTDNGTGMSKEDIGECFKPHTTSKLLHEDELVGIKTLGFRGEALSSIAAISHMTIKSRKEEESRGTLVNIKAGEIEEISAIGIPIGTSIIVANLFQSVPARKNFLKTSSTEFRYIVEIIMHYALSYSNVRFFLSHNKKIVLDLPKNQNITERIKMLLGNDIFSFLIPINQEDSYITIKGFLGKPQVTTTTQSKQFLFVNGRKITDKIISLAVKEIYGNLLEPKASPIFIIFLSIPHEIVDVNVHPRKEQVNFVNSKIIFDAVQQAVKKTLEENNITFQKTRWKDDPLYDVSNRRLFSNRSGNTSSYAGAVLKDEVQPWDVRKTIIQKDIIEQLHNVYLLAQTNTGIALVDQHAAHERILFEQFTKVFTLKKQISEKHRLKKALLMELSLNDAKLLKENNYIFLQLGFTIEFLHGNTFVIHTVPEILHDRNSIELIRELLEDLSQDKSINEIDKQNQKMIAYLACRSAIKAGEQLTKQQIKELIEKLEQTNNNTTCPHGRPTKIEISLKELHRMFKRN